MRRFFLGVVAAVAFVIPAATLATQAGAVTARPAASHASVHLTLSQRIAASFRMARQLAMQPAAGDSTLIYTENGIHGCMHAEPYGTGNPIIVRALASGPCDPVYEVFVQLDPQGFPEYRFAMQEPESWDIASTNGCDRLTQKAPSGNGTVMIIYTAPNGNQYLVPRYCVGLDDYSVQLGTQNVRGRQWAVTSDLSYYRSLTLSNQ